MQRRGQGIHKKIKTAFPYHCGIVGIRAGAEFALRVPTPFRQLIGHGRDPVLPPGLFQPHRVDFIAASSLSRDTHAQNWFA